METSAQRRDWSYGEVEATVAAYMEMLRNELAHMPFNKAERRRQLQRLLDRRTEAAIERKHQNVSAVLLELGLPYVDGYKPLRNYQDLLRAVVEQWVANHPELTNLVEAEIDRPPVAPTVEDILRALVDAPVATHHRPRPAVHEPKDWRYTSYRPNYLLLEARNSELGRAGEQFVLNYEVARLLAARAGHLAGRVEHVSVARGDHAGFDILSYETGGSERLIEVKTTGFGAHTPFFVSHNELTRSQVQPVQYHLYRVFAFRRQPQLFTVRGALDKTCTLDPSQYVARVG